MDYLIQLGVFFLTIILFLGAFIGILYAFIYIANLIVKINQIWRK